MTETPFMPKATAVWLVENTALTFDQIAEFCSLHPLEVKGIADGDVAQGIRGMDPIMSGELTRVELEAAEQNSEHTLKLNQTIVELPETTTKKQKTTKNNKEKLRKERWAFQPSFGPCTLPSFIPSILSPKS